MESCDIGIRYAVSDELQPDVKSLYDDAASALPWQILIGTALHASQAARHVVMTLTVL